MDPKDESIHDDWESMDDAFTLARHAQLGLRGSSENPANQEASRSALPEDPQSLLAQVRSGDHAAIDRAIEWLLIDPFCLRSGYLKSQLMRALAQQQLGERQIAAIQTVLLAVLPRGRREEFRDSCRLARAVNSDQFRRQLREVLDAAPTAELRQRVQWMLEGCERAAAPVEDERTRGARLLRPSVVHDNHGS